jgi:enoyl-CoA hydratase
MDAAEAERSGLVSRVVPAAQMLETALSVAETINGLGALSAMAVKECVNRAYEGTLSDGVSYERRLFHSLFATEDKNEGMDAFLGKRAAQFKHR